MKALGAFTGASDLSQHKVQVLSMTLPTSWRMVDPFLLFNRTMSWWDREAICIDFLFSSLTSDCIVNSYTEICIYRVILKKVSFGICRTFLISKEENNFTIESQDKGLSLSKFSWYLVIVKIIRIRHLKGHIS